MEYSIISGRVKETRRVRMSPPEEKAKRRGTRCKGASTRAKILRNEQETVKRLARLINCNFGEGDLWLQLLYPAGEEPATLEEAKEIITKKLRRIAALHKKRTGEKLRWILVDSNTDPRTGAETVIHHHLVMDRLAWEDVTAEWPEGRISYRLLDNRGDYTGIAKYMIDNAARGSKNRWRCSQGLKKPIYTVPVAIDEELLGEKITPPKGAEVRESVCSLDEESGGRSSYLRCVSPAEKTRARAGGGPLKSGKNREAAGRGGTLKTRGREGVTPEEGGGK